MRKVFSTHAVPVDGHLSGRNSDGGPPSQAFDGFTLSEPSARVPAPGVTHLHDEVIR